VEILWKPDMSGSRPQKKENIWFGQHDSWHSASCSKTQRTKEKNIPGGSLGGPRKFLWIESCHGIRLRVQTSWVLDTNHWEILWNMDNGKNLLWKVGFGVFAPPVPAASVENWC